MNLGRYIPMTWLACAILFELGCAYVGSTTGTDHAVVQGGKAEITISPTLKAEIPVNLALGDEVAKAAANSAVLYLKSIGGPITQLNRSEAFQKGMDAGLRKSADLRRQITDANRKELEQFVHQVVEKF